MSRQHSTYMDNVTDTLWNRASKRQINFDKDILVHFAYKASSARFGGRFHRICRDVFEETRLDDISSIFAHRFTDNSRSILVRKKPSKTGIKRV